MNEDLVKLIDAKRFTPVRIVEGYDMGEVDQLLDELEVEVAAGRSIRERVEVVRCTPVRLRGGYTMSEVDAFLDDLAAQVESRVMNVIETGAAGAPVEEIDTAPASPPDPVAYEHLSVIQEQHGLFSRLFGRKR